MLRKIKGENIKLIGSGVNSASTSSKAIIALKSVLVPANSFKAWDTVLIRTMFRKATALNSPYTIYLYWNTVSTLNGSQIQIATYNAAGTTPSPILLRTFKVRNNDTIDILNTTFSTHIDIGDFATTISNPAVQSSVDGYFIAAVICTGINRTEDTIVCSYLTIEV